MNPNPTNHYHSNVSATSCVSAQPDGSLSSQSDYKLPHFSAIRLSSVYVITKLAAVFSQPSRRHHEDEKGGIYPTCNTFDNASFFAVRELIFILFGSVFRKTRK